MSYHIAWKSSFLSPRGAFSAPDPLAVLACMCLRLPLVPACAEPAAWESPRQGTSRGVASITPASVSRTFCLETISKSSRTKRMTRREDPPKESPPPPFPSPPRTSEGMHPSPEGPPKDPERPLRPALDYRCNQAENVRQWGNIPDCQLMMVNEGNGRLRVSPPLPLPARPLPSTPPYLLPQPPPSFPRRLSAIGGD